MATLLQRQFSNRAYWEKREREAREKYLRTEAEELEEINRIYREMYRWCEDEINAFYGKYANAEGIDITEAKKRVAKEDVEAFQEQAKRYVEDRDFSDQANTELRLYNATMKINRLELLKAKIGLKLIDGTNKIDKYCGEKMTERAVDELTRQAGILGRTITQVDTLKRAKNIVGASFYNATYSQRIWSHMDRLKSEIAIQLQRGLIAGIGSREMARRLRESYDVSQSDAHRLMVTELRRVQTDSAIDSYKAMGFSQYEYMAVNPNACPICRSLNGKVYDIEGAEVGNPDHPLPPLHPRCHCSLAPHESEADYQAWLNYLDQGGRTVDWDKMSGVERARYEKFERGETQPPTQEEIQTAAESDDERELRDAAIDWYVSGEGMWINDYLRGGLDTELTDNEKLLYNALEKATDQPLPKSLKKLWRSVDASAIFDGMTSLEYSQLYEHIIYGKYDSGDYSQGIKKRMEAVIDKTKGKTITEDGFLSTTKEKSVAVEWGDFTGAEVPVVIEFGNVSPKVKGKDLKDYEYEEDPQYEVLLHPKAKYKVLDISAATDEDGGKYVKIDAEFI